MSDFLDPMDCSTPGFLFNHQHLELVYPHVHRVGDAIQSSHSLSSSFPPAFNLSQPQGLFQWVSSSHEVVKILELQLQHQSYQCIFRNDFPGDWLVWSPCCPKNSQKSSPAPQFKSMNSLAFFMVQLSHPYMITGKIIALTILTFVSKVMSLLFNMLSRLVIVFLWRSKTLLILWPKSPSAVILGPKKNKICHCFHCSPIYLSWNDGAGRHDLSFLNVEF